MSTNSSYQHRDTETQRIKKDSAPLRLRNPFKLLWLMFKTRRPSRISEMRAVPENFWLGRNYAAMMFFGHIIAHTQEECDHINATNGSVKRHETIHLRQAQACHNSWFCYYIIYIWYYLRALPMNRHLHNAAYRLNPFEMEAYEHMYEPDYLEKHCQGGANGWRRYARIKPRERAELLLKKHQSQRLDCSKFP